MCLAGQKCELHLCWTLAQGLSSTQHPFSILASGFQADSAPPVMGAEVRSGANAAWRCILTFWSFENVGAHMNVSFSILSQNPAATGGNWAGSILPIRAFSGFRYGFPFPSQGSKSLTRGVEEVSLLFCFCFSRKSWKPFSVYNNAAYMEKSGDIEQAKTKAKQTKRNPVEAFHL